VWVGTTQNFEVTSRATVEQTGVVGSSAEALLRAYLQFFHLDAKAVPKGGLKLNLFKDRAEFKARVTGAPPWAEALYRKGVSYAYFDASGASGYHWMLHETTHQLNELVGHTPKAKWVDEGLASYFGASRIEDNELVPGRSRRRPIRCGGCRNWGPRRRREGFRSGRVVPLRALVTGQGGPPIDTHVNQWYLGYWSLAHFLFHGAGRASTRLASASCSPARARRSPTSSATSARSMRCRPEWYRYLQGLSGEEGGGNVIVVD
jgi:hypothetical protein